MLTSRSNQSATAPVVKTPESTFTSPSSHTLKKKEKANKQTLAPAAGGQGLQDIWGEVRWSLLSLSNIKYKINNDKRGLRVPV